MIIYDWILMILFPVLIFVCVLLYRSNLIIYITPSISIVCLILFFMPMLDLVADLVPPGLSIKNGYWLLVR